MRKTGLAGAALAPLRDFASCRCRVDFIDRSTVFGQSGYPGVSCVRRLFLPIPKVERPALKRSGRTYALSVSRSGLFLAVREFADAPAPACSACEAPGDVIP
jgi:hypothetical protein